MSDTVTNTTTQLQRPSLWTVLFLNDDYTPMAFVVQILTVIFHQSADDAQRIMLRVHQEGKARVGAYTYEVASHKTDQTMLLATMMQHPLQVYPERC
jgi:ATP-dependent Clp protease adaptor protein ClpS